MKTNFKNNSNSIVKDIKSHNKFKAIDELFTRVPLLMELDNQNKLKQEVYKREMIQTTGLGNGIAIAHARCKEARKLVFVLGISYDGVNYDSMDGEPVHFLFMVIHPPEYQEQYIHILSAIGKMFCKCIKPNYNELMKKFNNISQELCCEFTKVISKLN